jgi:hypothetical protein
VPHVAAVWDLLEDDDLCEYWGFYLEDLVDAFDCPLEGEPAVPAVRLLTAHAEALIAASCAYVPASEPKMGWELGCYARVAMAHRLTASPACASLTLLIRRVAHLAERAPKKASFDARSKGQTAHPLQLGRERKRR